MPEPLTLPDAFTPPGFVAFGAATAPLAPAAPLGARPDPVPCPAAAALAAAELACWAADKAL
jgi:hypothetical protein